MSENISTPEQEKEEPIGRLSLSILIAGIIGCLQYFVIGIIGVIRGYSIQSYMPSHISLAGMMMLVIFCTIRGNNLARWKQNVLWTIALSPLFCSSLIGIQQTKYSMKGDEYYEQGQYAESIQYFRKETETGYLRLVYNSNEAFSLTKMAEAYCQLGNFSKAREIYLLIQQRRFHYCRGRAAQSINSLDSGLQKVKEYESLPTDEKNDVYVLYDLARIYEFDLHCKAKALDIYMKILSLPVADKSKELAKESIGRLAIKENN